MNEEPTPETDKIAESLLHERVDKRDYELRQHARRLERERDELRSDLEFRRGLFQLQEQQLNNIRAERDEWKAKYIQQNKDLRCEMMDPNGTIWDHAKKLQDENKTLQEQLKFERELNKHKAVADAISEDIDSICDIAKRLERERDAALRKLESLEESIASLDHPNIRILLRQAERYALDVAEKHENKYREIKKQLTDNNAERALADRLADCLNNLWHHHSLTEASYDYIDAALAAWKEARSE